MILNSKQIKIHLNIRDTCGLLRDLTLTKKTIIGYQLFDIYYWSLISNIYNKKSTSRHRSLIFFLIRKEVTVSCIIVLLKDSQDERLVVLCNKNFILAII